MSMVMNHRHLIKLYCCNDDKDDEEALHSSMCLSREPWSGNGSLIFID